MDCFNRVLCPGRDVFTYKYRGVQFKIEEGGGPSVQIETHQPSPARKLTLRSVWSRNLALLGSVRTRFDHLVSATNNLAMGLQRHYREFTNMYHKP